MIIATISLVIAALFLTHGVLYKGFDQVSQALLHIDLGFAIFRVLFFLCIVGLARLFYTGVRDIVEDVIVALAIYAVMLLVAAIAHEYREGSRHEWFWVIERTRMLSWVAVNVFVAYRVCHRYRKAKDGCVVKDQSASLIMHAR